MTRRAAPSPLAARVTDALRGIRRLVATLQASARTIEQRTGITNAQLFMLRALDGQRTMSLGDLADLAGAQQSTASIIVQRLVMAGLVRRARSSEDARRVELSLTAAGRRKVRDAPVPTTARLLEALRAMSAGELRALVASLEVLHARLGEDGEDPGMLFESPGPRAPRPPKPR
ncbi:MAG: MarR family winged helix-turn-helix transcriptional regulator [Gemmatimonadota bacterium]